MGDFKKYLCFFLVFAFAITAYSQTYIKGNGLYWVALLPNASVEKQIADKLTISGEFVYSPWKIDNSPLKFLMFTPDVRWYPNHSFKGFYLGAYLDTNIFKLSKSEFYRKHEMYQKGFSWGFGAEFGYDFRLSDRWVLELMIGGGRNMATYQGFNKYDQMYIDWNGSTEWLIYRVGVIIGYKIL
jgi:hypothetical protein